MVTEIPNGSIQLDIAGSIRALDRDHRVSIPKELLKAMNWSVAKGSLQVIAEIRGLGRVRLLEPSRVEERLAAIHERIQELHTQDEIDQALGALADRYRPVRLYPEGRVHLTEPVHAVIEPTLAPVSVLVELVATKGIEILSLGTRNDRLSRFSALLDIEA